MIKFIKPKLTSKKALKRLATELLILIVMGVLAVLTTASKTSWSHAFSAAGLMVAILATILFIAEIIGPTLILYMRRLEPSDAGSEQAQ